MVKKKLIGAFAFLSLLFLLTDCSCNPGRVTVKSVVLEIPTSASGFSEKLDKERFSAVLQRSIEENKDFVFNPKVEKGAVLRLALVPILERADTPALMLSATLVQSSDDAKEYRTFAEIPIIEGALSGKDVGLAMSKVLVNLHHLKEGNAQGNEEFLKRLEASAAGNDVDSGELLSAISLLGEMKEQRAIPSLIKILSATKNVAVGNACIVALGELEAEDAMPAIIEYVERKPAILRRQAIIAARQISSKEAAEWLLVMAYGHEDELVQKEAKAALLDVEKRLGFASIE